MLLFKGTKMVYSCLSIFMLVFFALYYNSYHVPQDPYLLDLHSVIIRATAEVLLSDHQHNQHRVCFMEGLLSLAINSQKWPFSTPAVRQGLFYGPLVTDTRHACVSFCHHNRSASRHVSHSQQGQSCGHQFPPILVLIIRQVLIIKTHSLNHTVLQVFGIVLYDGLLRM